MVKSAISYLKQKIHYNKINFLYNTKIQHFFLAFIIELDKQLFTLKNVEVGQ